MSSQQRPTCLITGLSGFIGKNLTDELTLDYTLYGISSSDFNNPLFEKIYNWDQLTELGTVDTCVHLAGLVHDTQGNSSDEDYININFELTRNLLHSLRGKCKRFIYLSSVKAVCEMNCTELSESAEYQPSSAYGLSKQMAEQYILENAASLGMEAIILRPVMVYGEGSKGNMNALIRFVRSGTPFPFASYKNEKSILYIRNLTFIIEQFANGQLPAGVYNVADNGKYSTKEIVEMIGDALNRKVRKWDLPQGLYRRFLTKGNGKISGMFKKLLGNLSVDTRKLQKTINKVLPFKSPDAFKDFLNP